MGMHFGARGLRAFSRPFCRRLSGVFERAPTFHSATGTFRLEFRADHALHAPTEIFVRAAGHPGWRLFIELPPADLKLCAFPDLREGTQYVHAPHWYDQITLFFGHFRPWCTLDAASLQPALGNGAVQRLHQRQLAKLEAEASSKFEEGGVPTLIGEVGVPFDLDGRARYHLPPQHPEDPDVDVPFINSDRALAHSVDCLDAINLSRSGCTSRRTRASGATAGTWRTCPSSRGRRRRGTWR